MLRWTSAISQPEQRTRSRQTKDLVKSDQGPSSRTWSSASMAPVTIVTGVSSPCRSWLPANTDWQLNPLIILFASQSCGVNNWRVQTFLNGSLVVSTQMLIFLHLKNTIRAPAVPKKNKCRVVVTLNVTIREGVKIIRFFRTTRSYAARIQFGGGFWGKTMKNQPGTMKNQE